MLGLGILACGAAPAASARAEAFLFSRSPTGVQKLDIVTNQGAFGDITPWYYGWYRDDGRSSQSNYGVGNIAAISHNFRDFLVFDLSVAHEQIAAPANFQVESVSVTLGNDAQGYTGPETSIFTAWRPGFGTLADFSEQRLAGDPRGIQVYNAMSGGQALQRVEVSDANNTSGEVRFNLNADVLGLVQQALIYPADRDHNYYFVFSGSLNEHIPEPPASRLVAAGLVLLGAVRRWRRAACGARRATGPRSAAARRWLAVPLLALVLASGRTAPAPAASLWTVFTPVEDATLSYDCGGNLCWAAAAANALAYAGWGVPNAAGVMNGQTVFDELKPIVLQLYGDQAGDYRNAAELYFDLHRSDWGVPASATWNDWQSNMIASAPVPLAWAPRIADLLNQGVAPMLSVSLPGGFHLINAWGYRASGLAFVHSDDIDRMVITDNENAILGPTQVEVPLDGNSISSFERVVRNAAGEPVLVKLDTPIGNVVGIKSRFGDVDVMVGNRLALAAYPTTYLNGADGQPIGPNGPLVLQGSDQPLVSSKLADFLTSIYAEHPEATGITDAPLIGFNGVTLTAADTGWSALRYTPGPQVADQVAGNGVDDLTAFSFNFPVLRTVRSATLTLELTPQSPGATTDQLFFDRRGYNPAGRRAGDGDVRSRGDAVRNRWPVPQPAVYAGRRRTRCGLRRRRHHPVRDAGGARRPGVERARAAGGAADAERHRRAGRGPPQFERDDRRKKRSSRSGCLLFGVIQAFGDC